jgi:hypothetical protein
MLNFTHYITATFDLFLISLLILRQAATSPWRVPKGLFDIASGKKKLWF